jgi:molybdopterin/thiamine biosynthesis adenylyltransferase
VSHVLIDHSPDLQQLQNEGYDILIKEGYLLIRDIPYVNSKQDLAFGILVSELDLSGDRTDKPKSHVTYWIGEHPCDREGKKITAIENSASPKALYEGAVANFTFSAKADYRDYHHKMTTYMSCICREAKNNFPHVDPRTFPVISAVDNKNIPFNYINTAATRSGIVEINSKIANQKIGIIGLGGTGSYVLDLVAKTEVAEIHIIDGDDFLNHNAFRSPGAPSLAELNAKPKKTEHLTSIYSNMHKGIIPHAVFLNESNINLLDGLDFVFICIDSGSARRVIIKQLVANKTPFVDVGLGVNISENKLSGIIRVTTSIPETHEYADSTIPYFDEDDEANEYATNIQIAELNSLNATLAIIQWKKLFGIYHDNRKAVCTSYSIDMGQIINKSITSNEEIECPV